MAISATQFTLLCVIGIILLARPAHAFGAGNIGSTSKIEGENWRHGDLEDVLLTLVASKAMGGKKFSKLDVKRIYFGNWLRDYSQAVDVGTVKNVSAEAIRIVLWILGFMSFGYGTKEFEVTTARLGCYRPEEHIDNPKDYADNEDARNYDRRLRGPIDERRELAIDPITGLKAYIASENLGIDTSAALVRKLYTQSIELGRRYGRNKNKADLHEALRLLGTANHCLEDFSAHSNYVELALIEMGERDVFPHVGRNCQVRIRGARSAVYPIVTGTFGGVDFLHSVTGEFDDKVTQSEIQELEGTLENAQQQGANQSLLQDLLHKLPDGIFGGKDEAGKADELQQNSAQHQMANTRISPREPEEWLQYINEAQRQIYPILEWHDDIMQSITEFMEKVPILPDLLENVSEQINIFVFSLMAPFMLPIITQIKNELNTGSGAIIQSSENAQHIVFRDDNSSDPTHSMLSKDHFSNILNEPAGKIAGQVLKWVIPQIVNAWDDERVDVERTMNRIVRGVFHHPALRDDGDDGASDGRRAMFAVVERWWNEKSEREKDGLRDQLSRDGVEEGRNHKPGVQDHGHGSAKKIGMPNMFTANHPGAPGGLGNLPSSGFAGTPMGQQASQQVSQFAGDAIGGGALGSIVGGIAGGLVGAVGTGVMNTFNDNDDSQTETQTRYGQDGSRTQTTTQYGGRPESGNYSQAQYSRTDDRRGGRNEEYSSYQQSSSGHGGGYSQSSQQTSTYGSGGYSSESRRYESSTTTTSSYGRREEQSSGYGSSGYQSGEMPGGYGSQQSYGGGESTGRYGSQQTYPRSDDNEQPSYGRSQQPHGRRNDDDDDEKPKYGRKKKDSDDDDDERPKYGQRKKKSDDEDSDDEKPKRHGHKKKDSDDEGRNTQRYGSGRQEESRYGSNTSGYGRQQQQEESYSSGGYGRTERDEYSGQGGYGRQETSSYGGGGGYGAQSEYPPGGRQEYSGRGGYDGRRGGNEEENEMPGGFGGDEDEGRRQGGYGRQNRGDEYSSGGYGGGESRW